MVIGLIAPTILESLIFIPFLLIGGFGCYIYKKILDFLVRKYL